MTWYYTAARQCGARARPGEPGKSSLAGTLAIVHYRADHDYFEEWVYNRASIDDAPVVWAREMDDASNRELARYFDARHVWLVDADTVPAKVSPVPGTPVAAQTRAHDG